MIKDTNTRIQLTISKKILSEYEFLSDEMGIGRGDLMRFALSFYLDYKEGLRNASRLLDNVRLVFTVPMRN